MTQDERRSGSTGRRLASERLNTGVQTLAILGAGAWGVYTFIYEARIKPSLEPPAVSVTTDLVKAGERDNHVAIRSTVTRKNVGQTGVRVLGLAYNVIGIRARFADRSAEAAALADGLAAKDRVVAARDYALTDPGTVILRQGMLFAGAIGAAGAGGGEAKPSDLYPGEAVSRDLIVYADRTQYDFVRFEVSLAYAKEDEPAVELRFDLSRDGALILTPRADCKAVPDVCARLKTTDFGTEFSLW